MQIGKILAQTINILDPQEAIKIAAGEVIERPAHIIKELIENSIDAQATSISIYTTAAGKKKIEVSDNGIGMSPEDARLCFAHHATSKISTVHDLESIITYGFRGEALSSIASVSSVKLLTKTADMQSATLIDMQHGKLSEQGLGARQTGTTITITDLFSSIPARKKFLKSDDTEWNLIVSIFQAFCLRYLNIHFKLFHNDHLSYNCPPTTELKTRCAQLWSNSIDNHIITLTPHTEKNISISGAICSPHYHRFNRGQIFTFVNNRWVKNIEITKGVIQGYDGVLPQNKYPAAFIFIDIDSNQVDINVHPKKEEVKFLHPGIVQRIVQETVRAGLNNNMSKPTARIEIKSEPITADQRFTPQSLEQLTTDANTSASSLPDPTLQALFASYKNQNSQYKDEKNNNTFNQNPFEAINPTIRQVSQQAIVFNAASPQKQPNTSDVATILTTNTNFNDDLEDKNELQKNDSFHQAEPYTVIGQLVNTYIMIEREEQLILIDQHSAHERILYERFKKNNVDIATIKLLFPHIIKLSKAQIDSILKYEPLFKQHGIEIEAFSDKEVLIIATPIQIQASAAEEIILMAISWITEQDTEQDNNDFFSNLHDKIITKKACASACKAGDKLDVAQINSLIKELDITPNNFCCPHGRPTCWPIGLKEIEKHFKRDYVGSKNSQPKLF